MFISRSEDLSLPRDPTSIPSKGLLYYERPMLNGSEWRCQDCSSHLLACANRTPVNASKVGLNFRGNSLSALSIEHQLPLPKISTVRH
jgi:hypothetical protein